MSITALYKNHRNMRTDLGNVISIKLEFILAYQIVLIDTALNTIVVVSPHPKYNPRPHPVCNQ